MLSERIFNSYLYAASELKAIEERYKIERAEAINDISPTMTMPDYSLGKIVTGSVSVENHAIYLLELNEKYEKAKKACLARVSLMDEAISLLYEDERAEFEAWKSNPILIYPNVLRTLKECLRYVLEGACDLQVAEEAEITVEEWDALIDAMEDDELFNDYWDKNDTFDKQIAKKRILHRINTGGRGFRSKAELEAS